MAPSFELDSDFRRTVPVDSRFAEAVEEGMELITVLGGLGSVNFVPPTLAIDVT